MLPSRHNRVSKHITTVVISKQDFILSDTPPPPAQPEKNPFTKMGMIQFWAVSTLFYLTFPLSLAVSYAVLGTRRTKQLLAALVHDFVQTILIALAVLLLLVWGLIEVLSPVWAWFGGG